MVLAGNQQFTRSRRRRIAIYLSRGQCYIIGGERHLRKSTRMIKPGRRTEWDYHICEFSTAMPRSFAASGTPYCLCSQLQQSLDCPSLAPLEANGIHECACDRSSPTSHAPVHTVWNLKCPSNAEISTYAMGIRWANSRLPTFVVTRCTDWPQQTSLDTKAMDSKAVYRIYNAGLS